MSREIKLANDKVFWVGGKRFTWNGKHIIDLMELTHCKPEEELVLDELFAWKDRILTINGDSARLIFPAENFDERKIGSKNTRPQRMTRDWKFGLEFNPLKWIEREYNIYD